MPQINVTRIATSDCLAEFSASQAERGKNAGAETWRNAKREAQAHRIMDRVAREGFKRYMQGFGAWSREEIAAWTSQDCDALLIQLVSGDMREAQSLCPGDGPGGVDWTAYETLAHEGTLSGRLFVSADSIYFDATA